jgi:hypothetical protein
MQPCLLNAHAAGEVGACGGGDAHFRLKRFDIIAKDAVSTGDTDFGSILYGQNAAAHRAESFHLRFCPPTEDAGRQRRHKIRMPRQNAKSAACIFGAK